MTPTIVFLVVIAAIVVMLLAFGLWRQEPDYRRDGITMRVLMEVLRERRRHSEVLGYTPEHDDEHSLNELATAAGCYCLYTGLGLRPSDWREDDTPRWWPFEADHWNPEDDRWNLMRAAALIIAEIERLDREAAKTAEASA